MWRTLTRILAPALAAFLGLAAPLAAQGIPRDVEIRYRDTISHGSECILTQKVTILGDAVLFASKERECGNSRRLQSDEQGEVLPLNRKTRAALKCEIAATAYPVMSCSNGERRKLARRRAEEIIRSDVVRIFETKLSAAGIQLAMDIEERQVQGEPGPKQVKTTIRRITQMDIRFEGGKCTLASVRKKETHDGRDKSVLSSRPMSCRILG